MRQIYQTNVRMEPIITEFACNFDAQCDLRVQKKPGLASYFRQVLISLYSML